MSDPRQYDLILRNLERGTIISLNDNAPGSMPSGELTVEYSLQSKTKVGLTDTAGNDWEILTTEHDGLVYGKVEQDGVTIEDSVITIEILGVQ